MVLSKLTIERVLGIAAAIIGTYSILEGIRIYPKRVSTMVGDHTLPILVGAFLLLFGILLVFFVKPKLLEVTYPARPIRLRMIYSMLLLFLYAGLIPYLGYNAATFITFVGLFRNFGSYKWLKCVLMAAAGTIVCYFVFIRWLTIPFPTRFLGL